MNKNLFPILLILLLSSCNENEMTIDSGTCIEVSRINELCGNAVLQIENPAYYHLGETANDLDNVFLASLHCDDMGIQTEEPFYIEIVEDQDKGNCAVCLALIAYSGEKYYDVRRVDGCSD